MNASMYVPVRINVRPALIPKRQLPCLAFRRRPLLRKYVRAVILYSGKKNRISDALLIY